MCAVENERSVVICDVAIGRVQQDLSELFVQRITYEVVAGRGTRVQANATVDAQEFTAAVQHAIADAQSAQ
jgi:hypothetical protein